MFQNNATVLQFLHYQGYRLLTFEFHVTRMKSLSLLKESYGNNISGNYDATDAMTVLLLLIVVLYNNNNYNINV